MKRALLLINPVSGRYRLGGDGEQRLVARLWALGLECAVVHTCPGKQPVPPLHLDDKELLIVHGGDGTVHQALRQAVDQRCPLALIPAGTANVLALETGVPLDLEGALRVIAAGETRTICLGQADGSLFHLMAGIGLDGYVIGRVNPRFKRWFGSLSYWIAGIPSLWHYPLPEFELTLDGESHRATFAVVANASNYGGQLIMAPQASLFEPSLDVCLFTSRNRSRFFRYLWAAFRGLHTRFPDVVYRKVQRVEVLGDQAVPIQLDGELVGRAPMVFSVAQVQLEMVLPGEGDGWEGEKAEAG